MAYLGSRASMYEVPLKVAVPPNSGPTAETDFQIRQPDDVVTLRNQKDAWSGQYFLTGDGSAVQYDATLYYRVTDPSAYVLPRDHVDPALQRLYRASAAMIASSHDLDDFLVAILRFRGSEGSSRTLRGCPGNGADRGLRIRHQCQCW